MKMMTATVAIAGCAAAWPACAGQLVEDALYEIQLKSGSDASAEGKTLPGLLGTYPAGREASGTSWQPDSTPGNDRGGSGLPRAGSADDIYQYARGTLGRGTAGIQFTTTTYPFAGSVVHQEVYGRDSLSSDSGWAGARLRGLAASYSFPVGRSSALFGYVGVPGEPALGPPVSYMRRLSGIDSPESARAGNWLGSGGNGSGVFTVGYSWDVLKLEGSAFSGRAQDAQSQSEKGTFKLDSASTRLSYNPAPNWAFQLSRGTISGLDQLEPEEDIRRVTLSATYNRVLSNGNWQSTAAWGRNARKSHEATMGYLLESTLRFNGSYAVFGRLEQVGSSELLREKQLAQSQNVKQSRLTLGYFHEIGARGPVTLNAGAFVSRYLVPSASSATYGGEPTSFMLFMHLNLK